MLICERHSNTCVSHDYYALRNNLKMYERNQSHWMITFIKNYFIQLHPFKKITYYDLHITILFVFYIVHLSRIIFILRRLWDTLY